MELPEKITNFMKGVNIMKTDYYNKFFLFIIAVLLLVNFLHGAFSTNNAIAANNSEKIGRYQISAWAAQISTGYHHSGYYVLDTVTGKVVESKSEIHSPE